MIPTDFAHAQVHRLLRSIPVLDPRRPHQCCLHQNSPLHQGGTDHFDQDVDVQLDICLKC